MSYCRICRTENNLKYSLKELRRITKKLDNSAKKLLHAAPAAQSGNICYDCEDRLHNFDKVVEDEEVDVDCTGDIVRLREESPVIVDDDELLYNMFFNKNKETLPRQLEQQRRPQTSVNASEFTQFSLGSDGDTEIIEVLTSRESTPLNDQINCSINHFIPNVSTAVMPAIPKKQVVEIIDLDQDDEKTIDKTDDEEIIFRKVEPHTGVKQINCVEKKSKNKRIRKRRCSDIETKLIASLSLLSSDSESELQTPIQKHSPTKSSAKQPEFIQKQCPLKLSTQATPTNTPSTTTTKLFACSLCGMHFSDGNSLQSHQLTHAYVNCPVCNIAFVVNQQLVHHMRSKHRSYSGSVLSERPKCPQDSAMTIRLRYMQRFTYYECQLCGQIDAVFKNHKSHVVTKHEDESKSLKDPMMKELKCHICKEKCGTQYLTLCCHLRREHPNKHAPQLREVTHTHPFGWSTARQRDVESSAKVFQFSTRKSRYFECKICKKVSAGYFKHWKHLNIHSNGSHDKLVKSIEEINQPVMKKPQVEGNEKDEVAAETMNTINKRKEKSSKKLEKKIIKVKQNESKRLTKSTTNELNNKKPNKLPKVSKKALKAALVKVKVKPVLKQFPTQKYKCRFCLHKFKGFCCLNRHKIQNHVQDEYHTCVECRKVFSDEEKLKLHSKKHHNAEQHILNLNKDLPRHRHHKRKCRGFDFESKAKIKNVQASLLDENCNTNSKYVDESLIVKNHSSFGEQKTSTTNDTVANINWLKDLMRFKVKSLTNTNNVELTYQCQYCTRLFGEHKVMLLHEQGHATRQDVPMVKRLTLTVPKES